MIAEPKPVEKRKISKVVIIDDHPIVAKGLSLLLDKQPDLTICGDVDNARGALQLIKEKTPDLAIIDISLKGMSGLELTSDIRNRYPDVRILVLSMHDEFLYAERALEAGAAGYVMKKERSGTILEPIRQILKGAVYVSENIKDQMLKNIVYGKGGHRSPSVRDLSNRELEVFQMVGQGFSTGEIAERLHLSKKTIHTYRFQIKNKLGLKSAKDLNKYAIKWRHVDRPS